MIKPIQTLLLMLILTISAYVNAAPDDDSFAEHKVVLQISDPDPFKQTLVLNVANNLIKHYGQDKIDIEIVAFGPGLRLLFDKNSNSKRIDSLSGSNVTFSACKNTMAGMGKKLGHPPVLHSEAKPVSAGVVRIMDLINKGYVLIKP